LRKRGVRVSLWTVWSFYDRHTSASKRSVYASEQNRADVAAARSAGKRRKSSLIAPAGLHRRDCTSTNMAALEVAAGAASGWSQGASRPLEDHHLRRRPALRRGHAPFVIDQPMNSVIFKAYLEQCLVPTLKPATSS